MERKQVTQVWFHQPQVIKKLRTWELEGSDLFRTRTFERVSAKNLKKKVWLPMLKFMCHASYLILLLVKEDKNTQTTCTSHFSPLLNCWNPMWSKINHLDQKFLSLLLACFALSSLNIHRPICHFSSLNRYMHGSLGYVSRYAVIYNLIINFLYQSHILLKITSCR